MNEAQQKLDAAARAVATAVGLLKVELPTMQAFLKEARDMDNFGHIVDPTLFRNSERRAVSAVVEPLFKAAIAFVATHDDQITKARAALDKVSAS